MTAPFQQALRDQLVAAADRDLARSTRRRRRRVSAFVAAIAAAAAGLISLLAPTPAAAIEVTIDDGRVEVRMVDLRTTPGEVRDAMVNAGLDARIIGVPVGPSAVGRFVNVRLEHGGATPITTIGSDGYTFDGFSLPTNWPGTLVIGVGERADPGTSYDAASDVFAPGEPLACVPLRGSTLESARGSLRTIETRVRPVEQGIAPIPLDDPIATGFDDWFIVEGQAFAPDQVILTLQPDEPDPTEPPAGC